MRRSLLVMVLWCAAVVAPAQSRPAGAAGEVPPAARNVIGSVMSPYCPGLLLSNCPSPSADSLRRAIVARAAGGETEPQLRQALIDVYGEQVLAAPALRGAGVVAWTVPFVLILGIGVAILAWLRRQRRDTPISAASMVAAPAVPGDDERLRRLAELVHRAG